MKRTMSNETRATRAIKMIYNAMATWEDVAEVLKISVSHCRESTTKAKQHIISC